MSTSRRRVFTVIFAIMVAALALVAQVALGALAGRGGGQTRAELTTEEVDAYKLRKVTNNKGKSAPGMCVYSKENDELVFKNIPKGNLDENDPVLIEIAKGGDFAYSQADCDVLNTERMNVRAKPPEHHAGSDVVEVDLDENPRAKGPPEPRNGVPFADNIPPPEAARAKEALEAMHQRMGAPGFRRAEP